MKTKKRNRALSNSSSPFPAWLSQWVSAQKIVLWGAADLRRFFTPSDRDGNRFPRAVSWVEPMTPAVMAGIRGGPTPAYADEYARVNQRINQCAAALSSEIEARGFHASPLAASERTDPVGIKGDFPHKTAATRAGLGWIGRHCQLITRRFGSWVRLGTVFTDLELPCGPPVERHFCGSCTRCVEACPAGALKGAAWFPGAPREDILDVQVCDRWKKTHYARYHNGHNCGICSAVCPYGLKVFKKRTAVTNGGGDPFRAHDGVVARKFLKKVLKNADTARGRAEEDRR